jgi:flavin reductase (DIM6/NTAB) family NADH-FMN oxidoreductase RutF
MLGHQSVPVSAVREMPVKFLPETIKRRLRPLPQWAAIGAREARDPVQVWLSAAATRFPVTQNHVIAALKPFTLGLGLTAPLQRALDTDPEPVLDFFDSQSGCSIASLQLRHERTLQSGTALIGTFHVTQHRQRCVRWPYRAWNRWLQGRAAARNTDPGNFAMTPESQQQVMIFYIRPRPVVLVSVECAAHANIFPMDLIGPVSPGLFTLALRSTSQSVEFMKICRRIALSDIAAADVQIAHALGRHHRHMQIDWQGLPFAVERSAHFSLPVPAIALRVRELEILDFASVGSHTLFICREQFEQRLREGLPLCHISGIAQHFRSRQPQPLSA